MLDQPRHTRLKVRNKNKWSKNVRIAYIIVVLSKKKHNKICNNSTITLLPIHPKNNSIVSDSTISDVTTPKNRKKWT